MGEYIDVGIQTSILPLSIILSSLVIGIYALLGVETENDDDDSDSGSGGLMQPIWKSFIASSIRVIIYNFKQPNNRSYK